METILTYISATVFFILSIVYVKDKFTQNKKIPFDIKEEKMSAV